MTQKDRQRERQVSTAAKNIIVTTANITHCYLCQIVNTETSDLPVRHNFQRSN